MSIFETTKGLLILVDFLTIVAAQLSVLMIGLRQP